ncbi:MAG TPA: GAF domain-containing protein, partial [Planctomycetota bacterium]|nr:GAF domain-containing protein [Planctomycetota bacterium]
MKNNDETPRNNLDSAAAPQEISTGKKDMPWWFLGVVALILYIINLAVLVYFTVSSSGVNSNMLIVFLVGLATTTLLTGLVCYAMISMYKGIQSAQGEVIKKGEQTADVQVYLKILSSLLRVSTLHSQHMEISKLLANIVKIVRESLNADQVSLMLLDEKDNRLYTKAVDGEYGPELEHIWKSALENSEAIAGWVIGKSEPLLLDERTDFSKFNGYVEKLAPISSAMSIPLHFGTKITGVININRLKPSNKSNFNQQDLMLLSIFGEDIAMTIENATLTRELKKAKTFSDLGLKENDQISVTPVPRMSDTRKIEALRPASGEVRPAASGEPRPSGREGRQSSQNIATQKIKDNIMSVSVKGTLDYLIGDELEKTIQGFIDRGTYRFIVDLADVDRISSEGIGIFTGFISAIQKKHGSIVLVQPNHQVKTA